MQKTKVVPGRYSEHRTRRGNVQVGRLKGKSNLRIARDAQAWKNLGQNRKAERKAEGMGKLALEREAKKLE